MNPRDVFLSRRRLIELERGRRLPRPRSITSFCPEPRLPPPWRKSRMSPARTR